MLSPESKKYAHKVKINIIRGPPCFRVTMSPGICSVHAEYLWNLLLIKSGLTIYFQIEDLGRTK